MKIAYVITRSDTIGGAQVHVRDLAKEMCKNGHNVIILVGGEGIYKDHLINNGLNVESVKFLNREINPLKDVYAIKDIIRILRAFKPDIVSLHSFKAGLLGRIAASFLGVPVILTAHGWSHIRKSSLLGRTVYKSIERCLSLIATKIVLVCNQDYIYAKNHLHIPETKLRVIHNGMKEVGYQSDEALDKKTVKYITVARFQEPKDFESLVLAFSQLRNSENWGLTLIGDGPLLEQVKERVNGLGISENVKFLGRSDQVHIELAKSNVFILISKSEGFPRSILEALRAGLPVLASDVGGVSESVIDGFNGFLIPAGDVNMLKQKLEVINENSMLRLTMGKEGKNLYKKMFTFEKMFEATFDLYCEILDGEVPESG